MAWDTERTKQLLLDAAVEEFSEHGLAGARVDRIGTRAGVNKERIYQYFGNKEALFDAVIAHELGRVTADVPITGSGPEAVGAYAGRLFDHITVNPQLARLMAWEGLERGTKTAAGLERSQHCADKIDKLMVAMPELSRAAAAHLLLTTVTLTDGWRILPQLAQFFLHQDAEGDPEAFAAERRAVLVTTVTAVARQAAA